MPRGGSRPGAGRPTGSGAKGKKASSGQAKKAAPKKAAKAAKTVAVGRPAPAPPPAPPVFDGEFIPAKMDPLEYMLSVMNNPRAEPDRRDRMAVAAAPFVHGKMGEKGKKDSRRDAAAAAGAGRFGSAPPPPRANRVN